MAVPESELDRLFALPLDEFVAERKRIAKTLAQAGHKDEARTLDKIARPSVSAWAVNQVARRDPTLVRRLGELTERLRGAQGRTSNGGSDDFAAMTAEHRQALGTLRDMVDEVLMGAGHEASPQLVRRAITNLRAGVADPETRPLIESGRLVRDVEEADFTTLFEALPPSAPAGAERPAARKAAPPAPPLPARSAPLAEDDGAAASRMAAQRAAREADRAREKARASAERRLVRLREAAERAAATLETEERTVAAARASLATKEEHLARVRAASEKAAGEVAAIEAELERLR